MLRALSGSQFFKIEIMGKYKKHILYSLYLIPFVAMVVTAYTGSKYRPESISVLFTDLSWLGNWPKWLDLPLMPYLNEGFDKLIREYGMFFEGINNFLLGLYTDMKNFMVGLPLSLIHI